MNEIKEQIENNIISINEILDGRLYWNLYKRGFFDNYSW